MVVVSDWIWFVIGILFCICVGFVIYKAYRKYQKPNQQNATKEYSKEEQFKQVWTEIFIENARVYNGLYSGLRRISSKNAKKPEKILREWCQRTHYKWEGQQADELCSQILLPLIESAETDEILKWTNLLLEAAKAAGIHEGKQGKFELYEAETEAYTEWSGEEIEEGDTIEVITPAWYQNDRLLEQGQCRLLEQDNEQGKMEE